MRWKLFLTIIIGSYCLSSNAQVNIESGPEGDPRLAKDFLIYQDYHHALIEYKKLVKHDSLNPDYLHGIGLCYIYSNVNKSKAIPYLEKLITLEKYDINAHYDLGNAYMLTYRLDEAIKQFNEFIKLAAGKDENQIPATRMIEMCNNVTELMKSPVNVRFSNVGKYVNSSYPDYHPFVTQYEDYYFFNSKRKGNIGNLVDYDGFLTSDLYIAEYKYGKWKKAKRYSAIINSALVEEIVGLTPDGKRIYVFYDNIYGKYQLFEGKKVGRSYRRPVVLGPNINRGGTQYVTSCCLGPHKKYMYFAAIFNHPDAQGGIDIYRSIKLPTGEWGPAENLGPDINTEYNEDFPSFTPDGKTFIFSSQGHNSMGGMDLFTCKWNKETNFWSDPVNMGYPVNTPDDEKHISFTRSGRYAYMSALRPEGFGDLDIYRLTFEDISPTFSIWKGAVLNQDSVSVFKIHDDKILQRKNEMAQIDTLVASGIPIDSLELPPDIPELNCKVLVTDKKTGKEFGVYRPNKKNAQFCVVLPPGNWIMEIQCSGYHSFKKEIKIADRDNRNTDHFSTFKLSSK